jgi:hypothetical protein
MINISTIKTAIRAMQQQGAYSQPAMAMALQHVKRYRLDLASIDRIDLHDGSILKALNESGELMHLHFLKDSKVLPHLLALRN